MKRVICDLCGSSKYKVIFKVDINKNNFRYFRYSRNIPKTADLTGKQTIVECDSCGLKYTNPRFTKKELELVYSSDNILGGNWKNFWYLFKTKEPDTFNKVMADNAFNDSFYQWKFDLIKNYLPEQSDPYKVLDIGCGDGKFVKDCLNRGLDAVGIDLSPDRVSQGKELYNLSDRELLCQNIDDFTENEKFDIIVMWDIIEHVESPTSVLNSIYRLCHEKTRLFILTMSTDSLTYKLFKENWNYINPTQHLHYFSHETMKQLLERNNFIMLGAEMDNTRDKNFIHLSYKVLVAHINHFFFDMYWNRRIYRYLFKPFHLRITESRMLKRIENLYPGKKYIGRYHDNFVFIAKIKA